MTKKTIVGDMDFTDLYKSGKLYKTHQGSGLWMYELILPLEKVRLRNDGSGIPFVTKMPVFVEGETALLCIKEHWDFPIFLHEEKFLTLDWLMLYGGTPRRDFPKRYLSEVTMP